MIVIQKGGENMKLKVTLTTLTMAGILLASPIITSAQTVTPGARRAANQAARLSTLHTLADSAINKRLTSLNEASTRINGLVKLTGDQKSQFSGEITTYVNGLTSLKTKADADTDLPTLKADYRSIFSTYRIYAEFLPQVHILTASDTMAVTADKLSDLAAKLQSRIQTAGNPGNLTNLFSDMQARITDAKTQYSNVQSQVTSLTPQSYDNNATGTTATLKNARSQIQTGSGDLKTAFADAKQIIQAIKGNTTNSSPTP